MKNIFRKILVGAIALTSIVGLSACGVKQDDTNPNKYYIEGLENAYRLYEEFVVVGKTLNIPLKDGTTKSIIITDEMVKQLPTNDDVFSIGEQTLIIEYEGVSYEFVIEIKDIVESVTFTGKMDWFKDDEFDPSQIRMEVLWQETQSMEIITLTEDMIVQQPNMAYQGSRSVKVEFEDEVYTFYINVQ